MIELDGTCVHRPAQLELKTAMRVAAYKSGDIDEIVHVDEREEKCHRWKVHHPSFHKYRASISKSIFLKCKRPS